MEFDDRTSHDPADRLAFIDWLVSEAVSGLLRSRANREALRAVLFLYLNRAYEAHLNPDLIAALIGSSQDCILDRAGLTGDEEEAVLDAYETLAPIIEAMYGDAERPVDE